MIQRNAIIEWRESAPWKELRFVEQDLVISRALVSIFQDEYLLSKLAFRGGTAIYKFINNTGYPVLMDGKTAVEPRSEAEIYVNSLTGGRQLRPSQM